MKLVLALIIFLSLPSASGLLQGQTAAQQVPAYDADSQLFIATFPSEVLGGNGNVSTNKTPAQKEMDIEKAAIESRRLELQQTAIADEATGWRESTLADDAKAVVEGRRIDVLSTAWRENHWQIVLRNRGPQAIAEIQGRISTSQSDELGPLITLPGFAGPGNAIGGFQARTVEMDGVRPPNPFSTFFIITSWKYLVP